METGEADPGRHLVPLAVSAVPSDGMAAPPTNPLKERADMVTRRGVDGKSHPIVLMCTECDDRLPRSRIRIRPQQRPIVGICALRSLSRIRPFVDSDILSGLDATGRRLPAGIYMARLATNGTVVTSPLVLLE